MSALPAQHPADAHTQIRVAGAREHNLKNVSVNIPKRRLTVFTGVSGSGKSSLVFGTIAAESQRLINETYSAFLQGFMPAQPRPDVDVLEGLTTAITVNQEPMGANPRSTVGTATDVNSLLRILFSRLGSPRVGSPNAFSFNVASVSGAGAVTVNRGGREVKERRSFEVLGGMCAHCEGRGSVSDFDLTELYDEAQSLAEGALKVPGYSMDGWWGRIFGNLFDLQKPLGAFSRKELDSLLYQAPTKLKVEGVNLTYEGLIPRIQKSMLSKDREAMQPHIRAFVDRAIVFRSCPDCAGTRLNAAARSSKINGLSIAEVCALQISEVATWVRTIAEPGLAPLLAKLTDTLDSFVQIGLGYLTLERPTSTLSGGESQRTKMIRHLGSPLTDATYVFDEPSIGLHPHDLQRMNQLLLRLRDQGNTVLVVEHKPELITIADHVVDLGPGAGADGGEICFAGTVAQLRSSRTLTGRHLDDRATLKAAVRSPTGSLSVRGANRHNLQHLDIDLPLGVLCVLTGVAGSGKSTLVHGYVATQDRVVAVDQTAITGSRRSNPATYTGLLDPVRTAFAKANGVKPALFSANSEGACPECKGTGMLYTELGMMATMERSCEVCEGKRYSAAVLHYTLGGKNIAEVLELSMLAAYEFFGGASEPTGTGSGAAGTTAPSGNADVNDANNNPTGRGPMIPKAVRILERLIEVGLGYLSLGQPLSTLSGGERQRLKLAIQMLADADVYVLDEPTTGLHLADVSQLLALLDRLVDAGKSVIVVEHHQAVMAHADWIVDLGPGAGQQGGQVVFAGTPADLVAAQSTLTGQHLAKYVAG